MEILFTYASYFLGILVAGYLIFLKSIKKESLNDLFSKENVKRFIIYWIVLAVINTLIAYVGTGSVNLTSDREYTALFLALFLTLINRETKEKNSEPKPKKDTGVFIVLLLLLCIVRNIGGIANAAWNGFMAGAEAAGKRAAKEVYLVDNSENKVGDFQFDKYQCDVFQTIDCGKLIKGTTSGKVDNFSSPDSLNGVKSKYLYHGADQLYRLEITQPKQVTVFLKNKSEQDLDLFLLNACNRKMEQHLITARAKSVATLWADEAIGPMLFEAGTYWLLVDGPNEKQQGDFELSVVCQ